jgi:predicted DNA-binding transcriptional regulator AlpA
MDNAKEIARHLGIFHRRWMDRLEASEYLGISDRHFDVTIRPHIRPVALGKRLVYDRNEIDAVMESKKMPEFPG